MRRHLEPWIEPHDNDRCTLLSCNISEQFILEMQSPQPSRPFCDFSTSRRWTSAGETTDRDIVLVGLLLGDRPPAGLLGDPPEQSYGKIPRSLYTVSMWLIATMYAAVRQSVCSSAALSRTFRYAAITFLRSFMSTSSTSQNSLRLF